MPSIKYRDGQNFPAVSVKVGDTLPVGTELDYDGNSVPLGYEQVADGDLIVSATEPQGNDRRKVWMQSNENIFDGVLESGTITDQGVNADNPDRKRSKNYLEVKENQTYTIRFNGNANVIVLFYSSNKTFLSQIPSTWGSQPYTFTTPTNTAYIRFISQDTTTTKALIKVGNEAPANEIGIEDKTYTLRNDNVYEKFEPQNEIYSTEEVRIGTWIDSKPLYRKVYNFGALPNNTSKSVALNISNLNEITSIRGICKNPTADFVTTIPIVFADGTNQLQVYVQSGQLSVYTSADRTSYTQSYIILEYTKTTDV